MASFPFHLEHLLEEEPFRALVDVVVHPLTYLESVQWQLTLSNVEVEK